MPAQTFRPRTAIGVGTWVTALVSWLAAILLCLPVSAASAQVTKAINPGAIAWSPDGRRLLYADPNGLWATTSSDSRRSVEIVRWHSSFGSYISQISWSPDGKRIAFIAKRPGDGWDTVWIANGDGSQLHDGLPVGSPIISAGIRGCGPKPGLTINVSLWLWAAERALYATTLRT
jgi:dipeptidyl aminopeptidase/acylaminoacyl peptidase